jgi:hypothetical protein
VTFFSEEVTGALVLILGAERNVADGLLEGTVTVTVPSSVLLPPSFMTTFRFALVVGLWLGVV